MILTTKIAFVEKIGGDTYNYYSYNSSTDALTLRNDSPTGGTGVLDLSGCSQLRSIGYDAFWDCRQLKFAHLPYSNGKLYVARDPECWYYHAGSEKTDGGVFYTGTKVLLGDTHETACYWAHSSSQYANINRHYNTKWHDRAYVYYHVGSASDVYQSDSSIKYWIEHPTDPNGYIMFESGTAANAYFTAHP